MKILVVMMALCMVVLSGCSGLLGEENVAPSPDAERLRHRVVELKRETTVAKVEMERLRREIARLEADNESLRADRERTAQELAAHQRAAEERADAVVPPPPVEIESQDLADEELAVSTPPPPSLAPRPAALPRPASPVPVPEGDVGQELYDQSYTLFHEKRYEAAEQGFRRYLGLQSAGNLADNAQFWIGESQFARGDFEAALEAYLATVERYPEGNKVPDALFKAGRAFEEMGDVERAAATWEEVVRRFGGTAAAAAAAERLAAQR